MADIEESIANGLHDTSVEDLDTTVENLTRKTDKPRRHHSALAAPGDDINEL